MGLERSPGPGPSSPGKNSPLAGPLELVGDTSRPDPGSPHVRECRVRELEELQKVVAGASEAQGRNVGK